MLQALAARDQFAVRRKNRRNANDVAGSDSGVTQRQLKAGKALAVFADSLCEKNLLRDERHEPCPVAVPPEVEKIGARKLASTRSEVNSIRRFESYRLVKLLFVEEDKAGSESVGDGFKFPELRVGEIGAGLGERLPFARDLKNADNVVI